MSYVAILLHLWLLVCLRQFYHSATQTEVENGTRVRVMVG